MTSPVNLTVRLVSPGMGAEPSGPNSTRTGADSFLMSLALADSGFFLRLRGAQSAGLRRTWNIMEPERKHYFKTLLTNVYIKNEI